MFGTLRKAKAWVRGQCVTVDVRPHRPDCTVVVMLTDDFGQPFYGVGQARCNSTDRWCTQTGIDIARGRAEADLARKFVAPDPMAMLITAMGRAALADAGERMLARGGSK